MPVEIAQPPAYIIDLLKYQTPAIIIAAIAASFQD